MIVQSLGMAYHPMKPKPVHLRMADLYRKGLSIREVARAVEMSPSNVRHWLKRLRVERRTVSEAKAGQGPAAHTVEASVRSRRRRPLPNRPVVGYKLDHCGYVQVWHEGRYIREHRMLMARHLGRDLLDTDVVHHINGVRHDNRIENLELKPTSGDHQREHSHTRRRDRAGRFAS